MTKGYPVKGRDDEEGGFTEGVKRVGKGSKGRLC